MLGIVIIVVAVTFFLVMVFKHRSDVQGKKHPKRFREIHRCESIIDIVMSVNHGRVYPFYTRMGFVNAKNAAMKMHSNPDAFEADLQMRELMGLAPYFDLPVSNEYIERVSVSFNNRGLVSSIGIDMKNFDKNLKPLVGEMVAKFGRPISVDDEFIIWREGTMVVNIHKEGSLNVIDENVL